MTTAIFDEATTFDQRYHTRFDLVRYLADRDGFECYLCPEPFSEERRPTIDHYLPLAKGGTWIVSNLKLAHRKCNQDKADRMFVDGILETKVRRVGYRERKANKQTILDEFCELCQNGRLLAEDERCPECYREMANWSWMYKMQPNDCPHSGKFWCWLDAAGIVSREPALIDVLNGDIDPEPVDG